KNVACHNHISDPSDGSYECREFKMASGYSEICISSSCDSYRPATSYEPDILEDIICSTTCTCQKQRVTREVSHLDMEHVDFFHTVYKIEALTWRNCLGPFHFQVTNFKYVTRTCDFEQVSTASIGNQIGFVSSCTIDPNGRDWTS